MQAKRFFPAALIFSLMIITACSNNPFETQAELENHASLGKSVEVSANLSPTIFYLLNFYNPWEGAVQSYSEQGFNFQSQGYMWLTGETLRLSGNTGPVTCSRFDGQPFAFYSFVMRTPGRLTVTSAAGVKQVEAGTPMPISFDGAEGWNNITSFQIELELQDESGPEAVDLDEFSLSTGGVLIP